MYPKMICQKIFVMLSGLVLLPALAGSGSTGMKNEGFPVVISTGEHEETSPLMSGYWTVRVFDSSGNRVPFSPDNTAWQGDENVAVDVHEGSVVLWGLEPGEYEFEIASGGTSDELSKPVYSIIKIVGIFEAWQEVELREETDELVATMEAIKIGSVQTEDGLHVDGKVTDPDLLESPMTIFWNDELVSEVQPSDDGQFEFNEGLFVTPEDNVVIRRNGTNVRIKVPPVFLPIKVLYVDRNATGNPDGLTWQTALPSPGIALDFAQQSYFKPEIWVARGKYRVTALAFDYPDKIRMFGGFVGNETWRDDRDPTSNVTILSGDVSNDDFGAAGGITKNPSDRRGNNSAHYCTFSKCNRFTRLDGFSITGFQGPLSPIRCKQGCGAVLRNLQFVGNEATDGGALEVQIGCTSQIEYCNFQNNKASDSGGAINVVEGSSGDPAAKCRISECNFTGNFAKNGGACRIDVTPGFARWRIQFLTCKFTGNSANSLGGAVCQVSSQSGTPPIVGGFFVNSLFNGNSAQTGGALFNGGSNAGRVHANIEFCTFDNNEAESGSAIFNSATQGGYGKIYMADSIVWNSGGNAELIVNDGHGAITTCQSCIIHGGIAGITNRNQGMASDVGGQSTALNPLFVDSNGPDNTPGNQDDNFSLQWNSPAIDYSAVPTLQSRFAITTDLNGNTRMTGHTIDCGAYEFH